MDQSLSDDVEIMTNEETDKAARGNPEGNDGGSYFESYEDLEVNICIFLFIDLFQSRSNLLKSLLTIPQLNRCLMRHDQNSIQKNKLLDMPIIILGISSSLAYHVAYSCFWLVPNLRAC